MTRMVLTPLATQFGSSLQVYSHGRNVQFNCADHGLPAVSSRASTGWQKS